jgi:hypothetical protein
MSKSRNSRASRNSQRQPTKPKPVRTAPASKPTVKTSIAEAVAELPEAQRTAAVDRTSRAVSEDQLRAAWEDVQRLRAAARQLDTQASEALERAQRQALELEQEAGKLTEREQALDSRTEELNSRSDELDGRAEELDERELTLADAKSELHASQQKLIERGDELTAKEQSLDLEQSERRRERDTITAERELLDEEHARFDQRLEQRTAARHEWFTAEVAALTERLAQARADRDRLEARVRASEDGTRTIGGRAPEDVLAELDALRDRRRELEEELARRPPAEQVDRVEELTRSNDALRDELASVRRQQGTVEIELNQLRTHAAAHQLADDRIKALEGTIAGYRAALEEEKQHFADLIARQEASPPFERMSAMDADLQLSEAPASRRHPNNLKAFVASVRSRIAARPLENGEHLYYAERDLRIFLAGLASSQLQILQGLSGTGKTSLPLAIAEAIDGGSAVVEVQAGWRDRQDLIGHYNTFERRYDETPFVQALYEAQCPAYADRPYFIVLDEMNLSHPEQYFTSLLSSITRERQEIPLTNAKLEPAPKLLRDGRILTIPPNVWFVGTANHDETTKEFADKTYDRAHIQELGVHPAQSSHEPLDPQEPVSFAALQQLFANAAHEHEEAAETARNYLHRELEETFQERFDVRWGNRLNPQINRFVPVLVAAGGDVGEAIDHVLATKILRKVRGRHDIRPDHLDTLEERIIDSWTQLEVETSPDASLEIIDKERQRLSGGLG